MRKLWIATELFYPEETSTAFIFTKIANILIHKYNVEVVCGEPVYDKNSVDDHEYFLNKEVKVTRVAGGDLNKNDLKSRLLRFIALSWKIFIFLRRNMKKGDKLFIATNPAPLILLCAFLKRFIKFEWIILVHDVFPENTVPAGIISSAKSRKYNLLKKLFDRAYSKSDKIIVLGRDMRDIILKKISPYQSKTQIVVIENWADTEHITPGEKDASLHDKFVIQYAGNVGRVQGLQDLLKNLKNSGNAHLEFHIIGEGAVKEDLIKFVKENEMSNVVFQGSFRRSEQQKVLNNCDMALVTLAEGMYGLGVPSKTYNILAAGKPIFYIGPENSEIDRIIKEYNVGVTFTISDNEQIISFLKGITTTDLQTETMKKNARKLAEEKYAEDIILKRIADFI